MRLSYLCEEYSLQIAPGHNENDEIILYNIYDNGKMIGYTLINLSGNDVKIEYIETSPPLGPTGVRQLLRKFLSLHPSIKTIGGYRISGASQDRIANVKIKDKL